MTIEDAHTHFFSHAFFGTLARLSPLGREPKELLADVAERTGIELPAPDAAAHARRWLRAMDGAGVARMVTFASVPPEAPVVAEAAASSEGRLIPYTIVDPSAGGSDEFCARALGEQGYRGLLLFPAMHHVSPDMPACQPILELAREHGVPVIVHCGILKVKLRDLVGLPRPYDLTHANPLSVVAAANRFPELTFVLPHFGGGFFREALMVGSQCENVMLDTSSSNDWMTTHPGGLDLAAVFRQCLDVFGAERILFGTDSSTFPRGYRTDIRDTQLAALSEAGAGDDQVEAIMGNNLRRLQPVIGG